MSISLLFLLFPLLPITHPFDIGRHKDETKVKQLLQRALKELPMASILGPSFQQPGGSFNATAAGGQIATATLPPQFDAHGCSSKLQGSGSSSTQQHYSEFKSDPTLR
jgi:hypothetical protein